MSEGARPDASRAQLEAWVLSTLPRAVAFAASLLRDRSLADDVVHDCYLRLLQKAADYDLVNDGTRLLFRSVTNACIDRNSRDRTFLSLDTGSPDDDARRAGVEDLRATGPPEAALQRELEGVLERGLLRLPVAQRAAVELRSLGYSLAEIADTLRTTADNAGVLVHRARKALASVLAEYQGSSRDE